MLVFGSVVLAVIMFWFILVAKIKDYWLYLNASLLEKPSSKRNGEIVSKLKTEASGPSGYRETSLKLKQRLRLK